MNTLLKRLLICLIAAASISATSISVIDPPELAKQSALQSISIHVAPIGFRPLSGRLEGKAVLADPMGACTMITDVHNYDEDIFILADDSECLESVKAKNIANSGGYVGIIKQNINNTLHDKQVNLVHIPIIEISPADFDMLMNAIKDNPDGKITLSIDFTDRSLTHKVNLEVWFSPTEKTSYSFILAMKEFLLEQDQAVKFSPHYVLQSQRQTKNYIGCYSSGKYCPTQIQYQGKYEGVNIVEQTLRQIILWKMSSSKWWTYFQNFYKGCILEYPEIFMNSTQLYFCSESALLKSGIELQAYQQQYNKSFLGNRKDADDNTYLLEERQHYTKEQISSHPIALINKKAVNMEVTPVKDKICKIQGDTQSGPCASKHNLSTSQIFIIVSSILIVFIAVAGVYRLYIHISMRREIKSEVDKTLEQYYRYIETFQGADGEISSKKHKPLREKSRPLTEQLEEVQDKPEIYVEMAEVKEK